MRGVETQMSAGNFIKVTQRKMKSAGDSQPPICNFWGLPCTFMQIFMHFYVFYIGLSYLAVNRSIIRMAVAAYTQQLFPAK